MLIRISLIVAIIAGLAVGGLNFVKVKEKITTLQNNLEEQTKGREKAETDLKKTRSDLTKTTADLKHTQEELATANDEKAKAVAAEAKATERAGQLTEELAKAKSDLGDSQADLAKYRQSGLSAEQVNTLSRDLKNSQDSLVGAQDENKVLGKKIAGLKAELAKYQDPTFTVPLPASLKGKILVSDPKWDFVVLDVGENQGVLKGGELLVSRNGNFVAKVVVGTVEKDRCIANIMPGYKLGDLMEGDQVVPAHPQS